jgi:hypothetical protein
MLCNESRMKSWLRRSCSFLSKILLHSDPNGMGIPSVRVQGHKTFRRHFLHLHTSVDSPSPRAAIRKSTEAKQLNYH